MSRNNSCAARYLVFQMRLQARRRRSSSSFWCFLSERHEVVVFLLLSPPANQRPREQSYLFTLNIKKDEQPKTARKATEDSKLDRDRERGRRALDQLKHHGLVKGCHQATGLPSAVTANPGVCLVRRPRINVLLLNLRHQSCHSRRATTLRLPSCSSKAMGPAERDLSR